jgi:broad specificity phosphatase PhoE
MEKKTIILRVPFYFIRHGQTDWNKNKQTLCNQDDIILNETGLMQAKEASTKVGTLGITKIYSSPLARAHETAEIINHVLAVQMEFHHGLREIANEKVAAAFAQILDESHTILIVSHGEVYRVLLRILEIESAIPNAKNCGIYLFKPSELSDDQWLVTVIN